MAFTFLHSSTLTIKVNSQMTGTSTSIDWIDEFRSSCQKKKKIINKVKKAGSLFTDVLGTKLFSNLSQLC